MDAFEKAKNVKKEIESAEALQRGPTLTKKYVYSILFSLSFFVQIFLGFRDLSKLNFA